MLEEFGSEITEAEGFVAFTAGGVSCLLPLMDVERIASEVLEGAPYVSMNQGVCRYVLLVRDGEVLFSVEAEEIEGLVQISPSHQYELPRECCCEANRCISGVAYRSDCKKLAFLFEPHMLRLGFAREEGI